MTKAVVGKQPLLRPRDGLRQIPTIPAVHTPLLQCLKQPVEQLNVQEMAGFLAQDKSLAVQCLYMANSPLFGQWQKVGSLRGAVISLGFHHVSVIALSCGVLNRLPGDKTSMDPVVFWSCSG